jgi:hypothetical protein
MSIVGVDPVKALASVRSTTNMLIAIKRLMLKEAIVGLLFWLGTD